MEIKVKNWVDHDIKVVLEGGDIRTYPQCTGSERLDSFNRAAFSVDGDIPVVESLYIHDDTRLPPKEEGTVWIVSRLVAELYKDERNDLIFPATNPKRDGASMDGTKVKHVRYFRKPNVLVR